VDYVTSVLSVASSSRTKSARSLKYLPPGKKALAFRAVHREFRGA
jgi:hypothetical protein